MQIPAPSGQPRWLAPVLAAIALLALAGPALVVAWAPAMPNRPAVARTPARVVPAAELPPVEPVTFQQLAPDDARAWNASIPFSRAANPAARPFFVGGDPANRARAIDCLAAAMLYEAGDDPVGERAVGQVVINRARHPAFPKTICGVVFQGQERRTGCQFTFTCDGAIARRPEPGAWERAQFLAEQALSGAVYAPVGHATHYHTDWVVPYWSASLDKITEVHTHLFFRWTGWWGTPPAFRRAVAEAEPVITKLAAWSPAHGADAMRDELAAATAEAGVLLAAEPTLAAVEGGTFLVTLDRKLDADALPGFARTTCGPRDYCKLLGWTRKQDTPKALPASLDQLGTMAFSYLRDRSRGFDKPLWNCATFKRDNPRECMKVQAVLPQPAATPAAPTTPRPNPSPTPRPTVSATPRTPPPAGP